jgi:hypothetical protein
LPGWGRWRESRANAVRAAVVVAVLVTAWGPARARDGGGGPGLSPGQVVGAFFLAQRDGDCGRLVDLVSEASWSDGGERSRHEFLDQCDAALEGYRPAVDQLVIRSVGEDGDRVPVAWSAGRSPAEVVYRDPEAVNGSLVREEGRWRVRLDGSVLHLGRSVPETVRGYLDAYNRADCARLVGFLAESVWSASATSRAEFVRRCEQEADDRRSLGPPLAVEAAGTIEVSDVEEERAEAAVTVALGGSPIRGDAGGRETVRLVKEGLQWRLAGSEGLPDDWAGAPLRAVVYAELEARLADEVVTGSACSTYVDNLDDGVVWSAPSDVSGDIVGIARSFSSCGAEVSVQRFTDDEPARRAAQSMADSVIDDPLPTARDHANHPVPGVPDAWGVRAGCDVEGCDSASAIAARGPVVVAVTMDSAAGDLDDAARILHAQLERL